TYYHPYVLECKRKKLVITVYDMIHELFPDMFSKEDPTVENKKKLLYGADHIIAISESTKRDILRLYPDISPDKITVIYIGSNMAPVKECAISLPEKFMLFVGNRGAYKNFLAFMKSVKPLLEQDTELHLVCLGGGAFNEEENALIAGVENQVVQMDAFDSALAYAYSKALCFVFPSLYEGFGIPTLEAFACDCPVVLSDTSSMPEVGGDATVYFDPHDEEDMRNKIGQVISNKDLRNQMVQKGRRQLAEFQWENIAAETIECYRKVLKEGMS
ncbi:MAG: glycosyltransferase family 4 protein, partial [Clostridiales bacterium]|nr:glycosyltransferase family 4 protein [Clostridiales bacterium]